MSQSLPVIPTCGQWSDCGVRDAGCCGLNLHGGRPSLGVCNACRHNPTRGREMPVRTVDAALTAQQQAEAEAARNQITRELWRSLHVVALAGRLTAEWLDSFGRSVPCGDCRIHWGELLKAMPPALDEGAFAWTVAAHNAVNRGLGKPEMSVDEAGRLYQGADACECVESGVCARGGA